MTAVHIEEGWVRVTLPWASEVYLVGPFNNWSTTSTPMRRAQDGVWQIELPPGVPAARTCFYAIRAGERRGTLVSHELQFEPIAG